MLLDNEIYVAGTLDDLKNTLVDCALDINDSVNVITNRDRAIKILSSFITDGFNIDFLDYKPEDWGEYDKEYSVFIFDNGDGFSVGIEEIYSYNTNIYLSSDGITFVDTVNCDAEVVKSLKDRSDLLLFCFSDDMNSCCDCCDCCDDDAVVHISKDRDGNTVGFTKTSSQEINGSNLHSSYSFYSTDLNLLKKISDEFGIKL